MLLAQIFYLVYFLIYYINIREFRDFAFQQHLFIRYDRHFLISKKFPNPLV